ncbi:cupin domain-containing protein [Flavilitoribacter nigricans]|uniref:Mannose-6-phosphate isomerase n=1 Tax=Flavilitoribacter nigricans (strain ATCC 23147 / DSM 23189 / NBRC 102662 / NCIMB 1420 / SS-2) TaxID=1122177 RepID=A0A2D0N5L1_FLAN2|nr:cupin domain-containing protein [Flavilitoribacter nigricans]PHN03795.1 mannose-6-phosphate isomerase [Flavilitoribacter nigricans DSM 23189 = NBRC 102662]
MLKKSVQDTPAFVAGDQTLIREVLHPKNETINLPYSLAYATLAPGQSSEAHILRTSSEVYVFVRGSAQVFVNEETTQVKPGDVIHIPEGARQHVRNDGNETLEFWCIVAPAWSAEDELVM